MSRAIKAHNYAYTMVTSIKSSYIQRWRLDRQAHDRLTNHVVVHLIFRNHKHTHRPEHQFTELQVSILVAETFILIVGNIFMTLITDIWVNLSV